MSAPYSDAAEEQSDLDTTAIVICPYCGEAVTILLDPGGGADQEYVEDCEVCCRPWQVRVRYVTGGAASVDVDVSD